MSFKIVFKARKSDFQILRYINLNIQKYVQTLVGCLPVFACTEKSFTAKWSLFVSTITYIHLSKIIKVLPLCFPSGRKGFEYASLLSMKRKTYSVFQAFLRPYYVGTSLYERTQNEQPAAPSDEHSTCTICERRITAKSYP